MSTRTRSANNPIGIPGWLAAGGILGLLLLLYLRKMYSFDKDTETKLATLEPVFGFKARLFLADVRRQLGLHPLITSARRTASQQNALHAADKRNPPGDVKNPDVHMRGIAIDLNFRSVEGGPLTVLKGSSKAVWAPIVKIADSYGFTYGGRDFPSYDDRNHFDGR